MTVSQLESAHSSADTLVSKLWLVEFRNAYDCFEYSGVFSTKEKAEQYVNKYSRYEQQNFAISEVTVDEK